VADEEEGLYLVTTHHYNDHRITTLCGCAYQDDSVRLAPPLPHRLRAMGFSFWKEYVHFRAFRYLQSRSQTTHSATAGFTLRSTTPSGPLYPYRTTEHHGPGATLIGPFCPFCPSASWRIWLGGGTRSPCGCYSCRRRSTSPFIPPTGAYLHQSPGPMADMSWGLQVLLAPAVAPSTQLGSEFVTHRITWHVIRTDRLRPSRSSVCAVDSESPRLCSDTSWPTQSR